MRTGRPPAARFRRPGGWAGLRERGQAQHPEPAGVLAAGDPRRPAIGRAVFGTLLAAAVFSAVTGPVKQIAPLYDHAPWLNDPFDTAVSFAMFFVPFIAACCLARVSLCRRAAPLPVTRVRDLLRGCRVVLAATAVTLLAEWVSVAIGENRGEWNGATWLQVGLLALMTALAIRAAVSLRRVPALSLAKDPGTAQHRHDHHCGAGESLAWLVSASGTQPAGLDRARAATGSAPSPAVGGRLRCRGVRPGRRSETGDR